MPVVWLCAFGHVFVEKTKARRRASAIVTGGCADATKNEKPAGSLKFIKAASDGPIVESWGNTILWFISRTWPGPDSSVR
jgi:hypothetical protein